MSSVDPPVSESLQPPVVVPPSWSNASQLSGLSQEDVNQIAAAVVGFLMEAVSRVSSADLSAASSSTITTVASK